ncbi:hypothetical protein D3C79_623500 [compost metagenome]
MVGISASTGRVVPVKANEPKLSSSSALCDTAWVEVCAAAPICSTCRPVLQPTRVEMSATPPGTAERVSPGVATAPVIMKRPRLVSYCTRQVANCGLRLVRISVCSSEATSAKVVAVDKSIVLITTWTPEISKVSVPAVMAANGATPPTMPEP